MRLLLILAVMALPVFSRDYDDYEEYEIYKKFNINSTIYNGTYLTIDGDSFLAPELVPYKRRVDTVESFERLVGHIKNPPPRADTDSFNHTKQFLMHLFNTSHSPQRMAFEMQRDSLAVIQAAGEADVFCSKQSLEDARTKIIEMMEKMDLFDSVMYQWQGLERPEQGVDAIRHMIEETSNVTEKYIAEYRNRCWGWMRIYILIDQVIRNDTQGNITKRVDDIIDVLSKWHTKDKFIVIAKSLQCDDADCGFHEDFMRYVAPEERYDKHVISTQGIAVIRTRASISRTIPDDTNLNRDFGTYIYFNANGKQQNGVRTKRNNRTGWLRMKGYIKQVEEDNINATCADAGTYFNNLPPSVLAYLAIYDEQCAPAIRSTHPDTVLTTDLELAHINGTRKSFRATAVFKCIQWEMAPDLPTCHL